MRTCNLRFMVGRPCIGPALLQHFNWSMRTCIVSDGTYYFCTTTLYADTKIYYSVFPSSGAILGSTHSNHVRRGRVLRAAPRARAPRAPSEFACFRS